MAKRVTFLIPSAQSETECLPIVPERIELYWEVLSDSELQRVKKLASTPSPNERGSFGNKSSPNKTPSPAKSRACRDTLTGRLRKRVGKPGSRRNRRWNNELELGRRDGELSDTGPLEDEFEEYLFEESVRDNVFYQMFENPDMLQSFLPFMDITEEDERALLGYLTESDSGEEVGTFITPSLIAYQRISTAGKKTIEKYSESDFLAELDQVIFDFVQAESLKEIACTNEFFTTLSPSFTDPRLGLVMKDSFHRFLVHNICCYYNAHSCSVLDSSGSKTVYISKPTNLRHTPHQGLVDYIKTTQVDESYWTTTVEKSKTKSKSKAKSKSTSQKQSRNRKRAPPVVFTEAGWFN